MELTKKIALVDATEAVKKNLRWAGFRCRFGRILRVPSS